MKFKEMKRRYNPVLNLNGFIVSEQNGIEFYIDSLIDYIETEEYGKIECVKPIGRDYAYVFVVCPRCSQIHMYNIIDIRKNHNIVYGNCKGRRLFCEEITDMIEKQKPFMIDESKR